MIPTKLLNPVGLSRAGWVTITAPTAKVGAFRDEATFQADDGRKFRAYKGRTRGGMVTTFRVRGTFSEGEEITGNLIDSPHADATTEFALHPWVGDNALALIPNVVVRHNGADHWGTGAFALRMTESSPVHQRWWVRRHLPDFGLIFEGWLEVNHLDPVGQFWGHLAWSNRNDPNMTKAFDFLGIGCTEYISLDFKERMGFVDPLHIEVDSGKWQWVNLVGADVELGDGDAIPVSGRMLCMPQYDSLPEDTDLSDFANPLSASVQSLAAAHHGPLLGGCMDWAGSWTASKVTPEINDKVRRNLTQDSQRWADSYGAGAIDASRPFGLGRHPFGTGDVDDFGATHGTHFIDGDMTMIPAYQYSAYADCLRGFMHYEADGAPLDLAAHTRWRTWSGPTHWHPGVSPDRLGKAVGLVFTLPNFVNYDRQHRSQNAAAAYRWMSDDPIMESLMAHQLTTDLADVRYAERQISAARAEGRVMGTFAHNVLISDGPVHDGYMKLLVDIAAQQKNSPLMASGRAMRVLGMHNPDGRKQIHDPQSGALIASTSCWEHGLAAVGMALGAKAAPLSADVRDVFQTVLEFLATWGCFEEGGQWYTVDDIAYLNGAALPGDLATTNPMMISNKGRGTGSWTLYGIGCAAKFLPEGPLKQKARSCWKALASPEPETRRDSTWRAAFGRID